MVYGSCNSSNGAWCRDPSDPLLFAVNRWSSSDRDLEKSKALRENRQLAQAGTADRGIGIS
jgi:hypothetical protein